VESRERVLVSESTVPVTWRLATPPSLLIKSLMAASTSRLLAMSLLPTTGAEISRLAMDPTVPTRLLTVPGATLSTVPVTVPVTGERRARRLLATPPRELIRFLRAASTSRLLAMSF
jgi:hypothetical protein